MLKKSLTKEQLYFLKEFYSLPSHKVILNKKERNKIWEDLKSNSSMDKYNEIKEICPSLYHQILKSKERNKNIQSAVFSECIYAQTLANMYNLTTFYNCYEEQYSFNNQIVEIMKSLNLKPRYIYENNEKTKLLIQAGGPAGIDSILVTILNNMIFTIEFKEPAAKTSEIDLPKYKEDGKLLITSEWLHSYSNFELMLSEHKNLNFFDSIGTNIKNFTRKSIQMATILNYFNNFTKQADVICSEDNQNNLIMIPSNHIDIWSDISGEIRPAGRNDYSVWTPNKLRNFLLKKSAIIVDDIVKISSKNLLPRIQRGSSGKISGYKINPLFFVRVEDIVIEKDLMIFKLNKVRQLNPTIAAKIFLKKTTNYKALKLEYDL